MITTKPVSGLIQTDAPAVSDPVEMVTPATPGEVYKKSVGDAWAPFGQPPVLWHLTHSAPSVADAGKNAPVLYSGKKTDGGAGSTAPETAVGGSHSGDRPAKLDAAGYRELGELLKKVDPKGADAARAIELIHAIRVQHPEVLDDLFLAENDEALVRLLGPYGYVGYDQIGKMARARFDYALSNFHRLAPDERYVLVNFPEVGELATRFGIWHRLSYAELQAADAQVVTRRLPDGTKHTGTGAEYRAASQNNINNHALAQLAQIRTAGPFSLIGRLFAGEKGAEAGAMFDTLAVHAQAGSERARSENHVPSGDYRTPVVDRRPPPAKAPAGEGMPGHGSNMTPANAGANPSNGGARNAVSTGAAKPSVSYESAQPRPAVRTDPAQGPAHASTQPPTAAPAGNANAANGAGNGNPRGNGGSGANGNSGSNGGGARGGGTLGSDANLARDQARRQAEQIREENTRVAGYRPPVPRREPGDGQAIDVNTALDLLARPNRTAAAGSHGVVESHSTSFHQSVWRDSLGRQDEAPVVFTVGNKIRIDVERLNPAERARYLEIIRAQNR